MSDKVYLIDGSGYIFRAYYAVHPLSTKAGLPTNALFGFTRMLLKLLSDAESENIIMFFDAGRETFRNELYPEYKANRSECPEDLVPQMPYFRKISKALGLKTLEMPGFEADDLIGTFSTKLSAAGIETVLVSGDKDLMQLVDEQVSIFDSMKEKHYSKEEVREKLGVYPEQVIEYLALVGDSSDNIPGLPGVGPKTAVALLEHYNNIDTILSSAAEIREDKRIRSRKKIADAIEENGELLRLCKKLVSIKTDCPLDIEYNGSTGSVLTVPDTGLLAYSKRSQVDPDILTALTEELEFSSLFKDLGQTKNKIEAQADYVTVDSNSFSDWLEKLKSVPEFSVDLETDSLSVLSAKIVGASFCWDNDQAFYIPIAHENCDITQVPIDQFISSLKDILEDPKIGKLGQNLKYDIGVFSNYGIEVQGIKFDTMLAAYLLEPDKGSYNLTTLSKQYLNLDVMEYSEATESLESFAQVDIKTATHYAAQDAHYVWLLREKLEEKLKAENLEDLLLTIEQPLVTVLSVMERNGIKLDTNFLSDMSITLEQKLTELMHEITELAGEEFNINSPKQLSTILFDKLNLPTKGLKKTKTGISTNAVTLEKLAEHHDLPKIILEYRELFKLKSTYVDALPGYISDITERLHGSFNQTVTATGRLSSSQPNLQNIPIRGEIGREVRKAFVAEPGNTLIAADYSQIELRVLAHLSDDENLIKAFDEDLDIHTQTALEILDVDPDEEISKDDRRIGKTMNFGIIYGMSGFRLGRELGIPVGVANQYIEDYFDYYSGVKEYFDNLEQQLEETGYVETLLGRKRYVSNIDTSGRDRGFLLRAAMNAPVQGTAADIIKLAMINVQKRISDDFPGLKMILQIHDELLFEIAEEEAQAALSMIVKEMESVMELKVPLKVSTGTGANWGMIE